MPKKYDILRLPPQDKPVYFVVESIMGEDPTVNSYRFEEGDCPTNFFGPGVVEIIADGDTDPHGLFEHVRSVQADFLTSGQAFSPDEEWRKLLPEAFD